jgi:hypothetical protein
VKAADLDAAITASFTARDGLRATWDYRALVARNVWDNQGITNIVRGGAGDYADWFGDPRFHNERSIYRPRTISLGLKVKL